MADPMQQAREFLAAEYERRGQHTMATMVRNGRADSGPEIMAITAALRAAPEVLHIRVAVGGEYGSFFLREGIAGEGDRRRHWCELTCNTSFGSVGYHWSHMGGPAAWFFDGIERDYLIGKLWMGSSTVFIAHKAVSEIRQLILQDRRAGDLSPEEARVRWDDLAGGADGEFEFMTLVNDNDWLSQIVYGGGRSFGEVTNPQAVGFMDRLWPAFLRELLAARPQGVTHG